MICLRAMYARLSELNRKQEVTVPKLAAREAGFPNSADQWVAPATCPAAVSRPNQSWARRHPQHLGDRGYNVLLITQVFITSCNDK